MDIWLDGKAVKLHSTQSKQLRSPLSEWQVGWLTYWLAGLLTGSLLDWLADYSPSSPTMHLCVKGPLSTRPNLIWRTLHMWNSSAAPHTSSYYTQYVCVWCTSVCVRQEKKRRCREGVREEDVCSERSEAKQSAQGLVHLIQTTAFTTSSFSRRSHAVISCSRAVPSTQQTWQPSLIA